MIRHIVSISGGKDSAATAAYVRDAGFDAEYVFADTGHEHELTLEYLDTLETVLGPIKRVKADFSDRIATKRDKLAERWRADGISETRIERAREVLQPTGIPMLDMAILKGRFASTKARFCTQELKVFPIEQQVYMPLIGQGHSVICWQGIRAQESAARARLPMASVEDPGIYVIRPILHWDAVTVFNFLKASDIPINPLYRNGMKRVGCMPCVMASKHELRAIAQRYPEHFERLAEWEGIVRDAAKCGEATFFAADKTPGDGEDRSNAMAVKDWAQTERGGRQMSLISATDDVSVCSSVYGLCE